MSLVVWNGSKVECLCGFIPKCFREEQEKLNVYVAYLNLENMYGSHESLTSLFDRALQHNDPASVYQQLITIYSRSGKMDVCTTT